MELGPSLNFMHAVLFEDSLQQKKDCSRLKVDDFIGNLKVQSVKRLNILALWTIPQKRLQLQK